MIQNNSNEDKNNYLHGNEFGCLGCGISTFSSKPHLIDYVYVGIIGYRCDIRNLDLATVVHCDV